MMDWLFILVLWVAVGVSLVMWDAKRWDSGPQARQNNDVSL
jgi:hypothetical protein